MRVQTTILVLGVWVLAGCASGETTTSCGERGPCPRGQVCVIDQCRVPITDGGPLDARLPDAQPVDMQAEDTAVDAVVDASVDAAVDASVDARVDALVDAGADASGRADPSAKSPATTNAKTPAAIQRIDFMRKAPPPRRRKTVSAQKTKLRARAARPQPDEELLTKPISGVDIPRPACAGAEDIDSGAGSMSDSTEVYSTSCGAAPRSGCATTRPTNWPGSETGARPQCETETDPPGRPAR